MSVCFIIFVSSPLKAVLSNQICMNPLNCFYSIALRVRLSHLFFYNILLFIFVLAYFSIHFTVLTAVLPTRNADSELRFIRIKPLNSVYTIA